MPAVVLPFQALTAAERRSHRLHRTGHDEVCAQPKRRPRPAAAGLPRSILTNFEKLYSKRPIAAEVIGQWIEQTLAESTEVS